MVLEEIKARVEELLQGRRVLWGKQQELKTRCRHPQKFMRWEPNKTHCLCGSEFWPHQYVVSPTVRHEFLLSEAEVENAPQTREIISRLVVAIEANLKHVRSLCPHPAGAKVISHSPDRGDECGICQQEYWEI